MYRRKLLQLFLLFVSAAVFSTPGSAVGGVYPNNDGINPPAPEPYTLGPGDSLGFLFVDEVSHVTINSGATISNQFSVSRSPLRLHDDASATINGGLLRNALTSGEPTIQANNQSRVVIHGGRFESLNSFEEVLIARNSGQVTIHGGEFYSSHSTNIHKFSRGDMVITGGNFLSEGSNSNLWLRLPGTTTVTGGTFRNLANSVPQFGRGVTVTGGDLSFSGASIDSAGQGIFVNATSSVVDLRGGSIQADHEGLSLFSGTVNLHGGQIAGSPDINQIGGELNLIVRSALLNGVPVHPGLVTATSGVFDVVYADFSVARLDFLRTDGTLRIVEVPEPEIGALLILAAVVLFSARLSRSE